ncbi:CKLF-like MARVEL transmembrane domain-containing protein 3 isoform X2 [Hypomesus transpacificus]|uniref:CKLF-like MARVEL transmembrane domain-containing protein 3 isoform X2 n=1 Tax=Hypomesus transpacificus TaxID=137520 RepID=UPI001F07EE65|nr:CKLF-like MARVEL transmembrane domain-containing protein 3 isoform X2 [Hypomesus transpacificus]
MGDIEAPETTQPRQNAMLSILPTKEFACSRKGQLLISEVVLSFVCFVCFVSSTAASFVSAPLIEFLAALFILFAYSTKINQKFKGFHWPLTVFGFIATIVFALDFYFIFNELADFLKQGGGGSDEPSRPPDNSDDDSDDDSD